MAHGLRSSLIALVASGVLCWVLPRSFLRAAGLRLKLLWTSLVAEGGQRRKTMWIVVWLVALVPMIHLTYLVRHYGVEVPTLDDWEMAPLILKAHTGQLHFADIFAQQQEGRTILPKLIFVLSAAGGHWDVRDQMMISVASCWLSAAGLFLLLRRAGLGLVAVAICFWLMVLTIFSPAQVELWIFAFGFPSFLPALFLVAALVTVTSQISTGAKFIICAILAAASSFTLPHGLLAWGLMFPALLAASRVPRWRWWLGLWVGVCALCSTFYFWGYEKPGYLPSFAPVAVSVFEYVRFILEFLGGGLAYFSKGHEGGTAAVFGLIQLIIFFLALACTMRRLKDRAFLAKVVPWFALGLYSLGSAFLAALGRVGFGADYALASRYVTFSVYLTVAVIALVAIMASEILRTRRSNRTRAWVCATCAVLIISYLTAYKVCAGNTLFFLRALSAKDRLAHAAVLFSATLDTSEVIKKTAYPDNAEPVVRNADALDRLNLLRPPLVRSNHVSALPHEIANGQRASGSCESAAEFEHDRYRATGWAILNAKGRPADCVVVAYQNPPDQEWIALAISDSFAMRADTVKKYRAMDYLWAGWTATFPRSLIPPGAKLSFWALDADAPKLYLLKDDRSSAR
jgi:hypothetical protein